LKKDVRKTGKAIIIREKRTSSGYAPKKSGETSHNIIRLKPLVIVSNARTGRSPTNIYVRPLKSEPCLTANESSDIYPKDDHVPVQQYDVGESNEGRPIRSIVIGKGDDTILIIASIHGNETAGTFLVQYLADYLPRHPDLLEGRKVMILPMANPDGEKRNSRYNARGVDLNRNFSAPNRRNSRRNGRSALSEPESRAIVRAIKQCNPNRIVTIHQPLSCIDYDGPARKLARHVAKHCRLPVRKLGAMPGSLGSYAGVKLGIPTITLELPKNSARFSSEHLWKQYGSVLIASILYPERSDLKT